MTDDSGADGPNSRGLRILAWPAFEGRDLQPYTHLLYTALAREGASVEGFTLRHLLRSKFDIVHVHWPEYGLAGRKASAVAWRALLFLVGVRLARVRGARLIWTVHNLAPHETDYASRTVARLFWRLFVPQVDAYIALTSGGVSSIEAAYPALTHVPHHVIPLGDYVSEYENAISRAQARDRLGIPHDAGVYLFIGQVRRYKDVPGLIRAFRAIGRDDRRLLVVGRPSGEDVREEAVQAAGNDQRVSLHLGFVASDEIQVYVNAADLLVMAGREVFNSATVLLALSFDRPILVPETETFQEMQALTSRNWILTYRNELGPEAMEAALEECATSGAAPREAFAWGVIGRRTLSAYRATLAVPRRRRPARRP